MKKKQKQNIQEGQMTYSQLTNGQHAGDFQSKEATDMEPFTGKCHVEVTRGGNMKYIELHHRKRNSPLFRQRHSSLSLGHNGMYYFVLTLSQQDVARLPETLVKEAQMAALKVYELIFKTTQQ